MFAVEVGGALGFEGVHFWAQYVAARVKHAVKGGAELFAEGCVLVGEAEERDGHGEN